MKGLLWAAFALLLASSSSGLAQEEPQSNPFGAVEAFWLPDAACEIGLGWERIIFDWSEIQPGGPDDWNPFNVPEEWLEAAAACNREVVGVIKHTPAWATDATPGIGLPRGLDLPVDDPDNLWANFMRRLTGYYGERGVSRFIVWNEPDIPAGVYGYEFEGDVDDYARLLQVAYLAGNVGNPDVGIILAGTTYWHDVNAGQPLYVERLLTALEALPDAAANGYFFDALALHIYFRTDTLYTITHTYAELLAQHGLSDKSIWIVETNASPNLDPLWPVTRPQYQITLDQQANFLVQAAALGLAAGADRIGVYKFFDWSIAPGAESFALIRADESRRPAYSAWGRVIEIFRGVDSAALAQDDAVSVVRLTRTDGTVILVAWSRTGEPVRLQATSTSSSARLSDAYGTLAASAQTDGQYTMLLPGAVCDRRDGCAVGGAPSLIQFDDSVSTVARWSGDTLTPLVFGEDIQPHE